MKLIKILLFCTCFVSCFAFAANVSDELAKAQLSGRLLARKMSFEEGLNSFCGKQGYVPKSFLDEFNKTFEKQIELSKKYVDENTPGALEEMRKEIKANVYQMMEADYRSTAGNSMTPLEYCKQFDEGKGIIINSWKAEFKNLYPNWF